MQDRIKRACGHIEEIVMYGGRYEEQRSRLSKQVCKACYRAQQAGAASGLVARHFGALPELVGTPKQTGWARDIRAAKLAEVAAPFEAAGMRVSDHIDDGGDMALVAALLRQTDASWWIDRRDLAARQIANSMR